MDGFERASSGGVDALTRIVMELGQRMGAVEQDVRSRVTVEKLLQVFNELQASNKTEIRELKSDVRDLLGSHKTEVGKSLSDSQTQQMNLMNLVADKAVERALEVERVREKKARDELDAKAKDAARGVAIIMWAVGPIVGGIVVFGALVFVKALTGWSL